MSNWNDFNDASQPPSFDLIPRNTAAKLRLTTAPGGYVQRQLATAIGLHESRRGSQLKTLLSGVAPGAVEVLQENACSIRLPSGQTTAFFPAGVIGEVAAPV